MSSNENLSDFLKSATLNQLRNIQQQIIHQVSLLEFVQDQVPETIDDDQTIIENIGSDPISPVVSRFQEELESRNLEPGKGYYLQTIGKHGRHIVNSHEMTYGIVFILDGSVKITMGGEELCPEKVFKIEKDVQVNGTGERGICLWVFWNSEPWLKPQSIFEHEVWLGKQGISMEDYTELILSQMYIGEPSVE